MADPRIQTVVNTLVENGHNATGTGADTDTLATMIVNALDREHGSGEVAAEPAPTVSDAPS